MPQFMNFFSNALAASSCSRLAIAEKNGFRIRLLIAYRNEVEKLKKLVDGVPKNLR